MAQPANTDIRVFRSIRSFRQMHRHESVAALIKRLRPLVMSIPAEEILVEVKSRDTATADFSPYMGEARHNANRGFPIVIGLKDQVSFAEAQTNIPELDFGIQIGHDKFLFNTVAGLSRDLHQDARDLMPVIDVQAIQEAQTAQKELDVQYAQEAREEREELDGLEARDGLERGEHAQGDRYAQEDREARSREARDVQDAQENRDIQDAQNAQDAQDDQEARGE